MVKQEKSDFEFDPLTHAGIGAAIEVHTVLGPGYLEALYEEALAIELENRGIAFERQYSVGVSYKGRIVGEGRLDFLVGRKLVVEALLPIHTAQVLSYLKATHCQIGLLINFNVPILKQGVRRLALSS